MKLTSIVDYYPFSTFEIHHVSNRRTKSVFTIKKELKGIANIEQYFLSANFFSYA
jgi:hypothetical protein